MREGDLEKWLNGAKVIHESLYSTILVKRSQGDTEHDWRHNSCHVVKVVKGPETGRNLERWPHDVSLERHLQVILGNVDGRGGNQNIRELLDYQYDSRSSEHFLKFPYYPIVLSQVYPPTPSLPNPDLEQLSRSIAFQLCTGLNYLHSMGVAHRDVSPENIMLDWDGTVKIGDFGVAWPDPEVYDMIDGPSEYGQPGEMVESQSMICQIGTGCYRAPELLFGSNDYNAYAIDAWATGVVIAQFFTSPATLAGLSDDVQAPGSQLFDDSFGDVGLAGSIFRLLGTPTPLTWQEFSTLPDAGKIEFDHSDPQPLIERLPRLVDSPSSFRDGALDFLEGLLRLPAGDRMVMLETVEHPWFTDAGPILVPPDCSAMIPSRHDGSVDSPRQSGTVVLSSDVNGITLDRILERWMKPARRKLEGIFAQRGSSSQH